MFLSRTVWLALGLFAMPLVSTAPAFSQRMIEQQYARDSIRPGTQLYKDVERLAKAGMIPVYANSPLVNGETIFAGALVPTVDSLLDVLDRITTDHRRDLWRDDIKIYFALINVIRSVKPEIMEDSKLNAKVSRLMERLAVGMVPMPHWVYSALEQVYFKGEDYIVLAPDGSLPVSMHLTRDEFAGFVEQEFSAVRGKIPSALKRQPRYMVALRHLLQEFTPELTARHADLVSMNAQVVQPFDDVPLDHWAATSVESAWRVGILKGYPDGTFRGAR